MKNHFGMPVLENTTPSAELPCDFCAKIGPLQLLVFLLSFYLFFFLLRFIRSVKYTLFVKQVFINNDR